VGQDVRAMFFFLLRSIRIEEVRESENDIDVSWEARQGHDL
jgi:hypothetical protein